MVLKSKFNKGDERRNLLEREIYKLFVSQCTNIIELSWETSQPLSLFPGASNIIPPSFLTSLINLKKLSISNGEDSVDVEKLQRYFEVSEFLDL